MKRKAKLEKQQKKKRNEKQGLIDKVLNLAI